MALQLLKERRERAGPAKGPKQGLVGATFFRHWKGKVRILISKSHGEAGRGLRQGRAWWPGRRDKDRACLCVCRAEGAIWQRFERGAGGRQAPKITDCTGNLDEGEETSIVLSRERNWGAEAKGCCVRVS